MYLRRLELFGFKSFADRTQLDFHNSLTGIVGPNGCGKSNVVDAIRWVLGEQRPTSMRGGEMADVIFKGSASRPPLSIAEVSLVLDNSGEELPGRGAEVSITRRVFKSGEGEYLIGGERVRLKDVRDMLFDTGLGSRGYAVLEQGRIDAVLSANPLDRRAIFEEAAGISRYRQRRKETESRLKRVEADMQRMEDVLRELGGRVRSLKIQAGKAERFVAARDAWRAERARLLRHRVFAHNVQLAELRGVLAELEQRAEDLRVRRQGGESDVSAREQGRLGLAAEVDRLADEVAQLAGEARATDERHAQTLKRIEAWRASGGQEAGRALQLAGQLEVREAELENLQSLIVRHEATSAEAEGLARERSRCLREAQRKVSELRAESQQQNEIVLGLLHEKTAASNRLRHLGEARGPLEKRLERCSARFFESRAAVDSLRALAAATGERTARAQDALWRAESERVASAERLQALEAARGELDRERGEQQLEAARLASRAAALLDFEREGEALESGARAVLERSRSPQAGPCGPDDLHGVLADHLRTSTEYARALDAALGERALALVVDSPQLAGGIAHWLKQGRLGQVRLLVRAGLSGLAPAPVPDANAPVSGRLLEHVDFDAGYEELARFLIGDVYLARDLDRALQMIGTHPRLRFVTTDGDLVDAGGLVGGQREVAQGAVGRRSSAEELEREHAAVEQGLQAIVARLREVETQWTECAEAHGAHEARCESCRATLEQARSEGHTARARLADLGEALDLAQRENDGVALELERLEAELAAARGELSNGESSFQTENARWQELELQRQAAERQRDLLQSQEQETRVELARVRAELAGHESRAADLARSCDETRAELERTRRLSEEQARSVAEATEEVARLRRECDRLLELRGQAEEKLGELRRSERAGREAIEDFRRLVDQVTRELEGVLAELSEKRLGEQRLDLERGELLARAEEELSLSEAQLLDDFMPEPELSEPEALAALDARVVELKRELDKLGAVNTEAVDELAETEGRFEFLDSQRKDLVRSRLNLAETLKTINEESVRLFLETFEEVRGHFQLLFRQLFGGGRADLELAAGADPLEAGIEISARPPGREMLPIGLLSGGQRSMTALALLFAVFKARPSPFCVLDEVDAALDDANIGRFLGMLDTFRKETQFIIVTHNKGSMAACQGLYGITMETKGVSRHVAVEFGEVERFDPEATGDERAASESRARVASPQPAGEPPASGEVELEITAQSPAAPQSRPTGATLDPQPAQS